MTPCTGARSMVEAKPSATRAAPSYTLTDTPPSEEATMVVTSPSAGR